MFQMRSRYLQSLIIVSFVVIVGLCGCKSAATTSNAVRAEATAATQVPPEIKVMPSKAFTAADLAKLKWIEGDWRGMNDDKPFYERYRFEGTTMVVEGFDDDTFSNPKAPERFELRDDGEFSHLSGNSKAAASSITDDAVQFVPVFGGGNSFRFERQPGGKWQAVLEWPAKGDKPAEQKIYQMEPVKRGKKG